MTWIKERYLFMERVAWEWWRFIPLPSMGESEESSWKAACCPIARRSKLGLHKNLSEIVIPSVLTRYDTPQLMQAIFPRPIFLINPANAMGQELRSRFVEEALNNVRIGQGPWASPIESSSSIEVSAIHCHSNGT